MLNITIIEEPLTDGSSVYDVVLNLDANAIRFNAVTKRDADELSYGIATLVGKHTNLHITFELEG